MLGLNAFSTGGPYTLVEATSDGTDSLLVLSTAVTLYKTMRLFAIGGPDYSSQDFFFPMSLPYMSKLRIQKTSPRMRGLGYFTQSIFLVIEPFGVVNR